MPKVKEIFKVTKGKKVETTVDKPTSNAVRYIQIGDLRDDSNLKYTEETRLICVTEKDIVIAWDGAYAGLVGFGLTGIIGSTLARLSLREGYDKGIEPRYAGYFLKNQFKYLQKTAAGAAIPHISKNALDEIEINIPDLQTQTQIVAALDKAKSLVDKRQKSIEHLDKLLRATFLEMFGDPVSNPKGWSIKSLEKLGKWQSGGTPLRSNQYNYSGNIPWYSSGELNDIFTAESNEFITEKAIKESSAKLIEPNSLLVGMYDTAALKSSITRVSSSCNQAIAFSRLSDDICSTIYVYYALQIAREYFLNKRRGVRQRNLNLSMIKNLRIPIPDLDTQKQFENIVKSALIIKKKYHDGKLLLEQLFLSLLQRAFHGDLSFDIDLQLDAFLSNEDFDAISKDDVLVQRLIDRFNQHNQQNRETTAEEKPVKFTSVGDYEKAKRILFNLMKVNKVGQVYDKEAKKTTIEML